MRLPPIPRVSIASKLAPTLDRCVHKICITEINCGSELARDEASKNTETRNQAQTETKKKLKTNPTPTNHTSERRIAQSAR